MLAGQLGTDVLTKNTKTKGTFSRWAVRSAVIVSGQKMVF